MAIQVAARPGQTAHGHHEKVKLAFISRVKRNLELAWNRCQIGHRSEYSLERFLAFRDYCQRTSTAHGVAVCVLTPIPALLTALLIDCIPLRPPSEGWRANYGLWIRQTLAMFCEAVGVVFQVREVIDAGVISNTGAVKVGLGTAISSVLVTIVVAALWKFPIPFGYVLLLNVYVLLFASSMILVIGPRVLKGSPLLQQQIKSQLFIIASQGVVAVFYPVFSAIFTRLSGIEQTMFILVMPMIKFFTKQNIANAAENCHEYVGPIVVFSVDLFNVYYVAICMQTSKSVGTTLVIMAADSFHLVLALRSMLHHTHKSKVDKDKFFSVALERICDVNRGAKGPPTIRLFSPIPLPISNDSRVLMGKFENTDQFANDKAVNRRCPSRATVTRNLKIGPTLLKPSTPFIHRFDKQKQVLPTIPDDFQRSGELQNVVSSTNSSNPTFRTMFTARTIEKEIYDVLQTLFHSEYVLLAEYTEFMVPMLYAPYLVAIFHLPVAAYYPNTASVDESKLRSTVANILIYAMIEFAAFAALLYILRRKIGCSPLLQLAFVLETHAPALQGHLFVWTITILHLTLTHYGVDFSIRLS